MNYFPVLFSFFDENYNSGGDSMKNPSKKLLTSADCDIDIQACTGLIPALPETDAELEHYQDLYHYLPDTPDQAEYNSDKARS